MREGIEIPFADIDGIELGNAQDTEAVTGCTVIICRAGAVGAGEVRGMASGTREMDTLNPLHVVPKVHAIMLAGGSAFGLDASGGAMQYLEEQGIGYDTGLAKVPIVPSAIIYDLYIGNPSVRPDRAMGYNACLAAGGGEKPQGSVGAGIGAIIGKLYGLRRSMKGGLGMAAVTLAGNIQVGALAIVNSFGDVRNPYTGKILAGAREPENPGEYTDTVKKLSEGVKIGGFHRENTTLGVVATNARFAKLEMQKIVRFAHGAFSRVLAPAHSQVDGDVIFGLATGGTEGGEVMRTGIVAAELMIEAVMRAVMEADGFGIITDWKNRGKEGFKV